ncbi:flagellar FlbD family protein [Caenibacillus caldisaponilyticus]|jgi:flagellar protein FlbD|uniref:flagellar FlbD family protein n=1 Tax=Caenibacillus caldisaponilyticus TaxID=1674942 RepID=UPI0009884EB8|nr:flagellar FlbD family protein [Caenibacillus caldisaponilyticus]
MIKLTRLNGKTFTLNACFIEQVEELPDTTVTLISGKKIVVKESEAEVVERMIDFYKKIGLYAVQSKSERGSAHV